MLFVSIDAKTEEEEDVAAEMKKRVPLSLEEILAKKKAEEEAQSKVRELNNILGHDLDDAFCLSFQLMLE